MRDIRAAGGSESPSGASVAASDASGVGNDTGGGVDWADFASVDREYARVYGLLSAGERVPASQVRLLEKRHAEMRKQEDVCASHISEADYIVEVHWRDSVWTTQLQSAFRRLAASGCSDVEDVFNDMLANVGSITKAGRHRSG